VPRGRGFLQASNHQTVVRTGKVQIKIMVLKELGFDDELIERLLGRNPTFMHLRNV